MGCISAFDPGIIRTLLRLLSALEGAFVFGIFWPLFSFANKDVMYSSALAFPARFYWRVV